MWKIIESSLYSINFIDDGTLKIYVTDFVNLWYVYFSQEQFLLVLRDSNSSLSGSNNEVFITKGKETLRSPEKLVSVDITPEEDSLLIFIIKSYGYPFKIRLKLQRSSRELFFEIVTKPLLKIVNDLKNGESKLRQLLIKKDKEIERYKRENIHVLQYLKTPAFDEEKHKQQHKQYEDTFGTSDVPIQLLTKVVVFPEDQIKIEVKEEVMKMEPTDSTSQENLELQNEIIPNATIDLKRNDVKIEENVKTEPFNTQEISPRKKKKKLNI